jgi:hypothetical protein
VCQHIKNLRIGRESAENAAFGTWKVATNEWHPSTEMTQLIFPEAGLGERLFTPRKRRENSEVDFTGRMTADDFLARATTAIENRFLLPHLAISGSTDVELGCQLAVIETMLSDRLNDS